MLNTFKVSTKISQYQVVSKRFQSNDTCIRVRSQTVPTPLRIRKLSVAAITRAALLFSTSTWWAWANTAAATKIKYQAIKRIVGIFSSTYPYSVDYIQKMSVGTLAVWRRRLESTRGLETKRILATLKKISIRLSVSYTECFNHFTFLSDNPFWWGSH